MSCPCGNFITIVATLPITFWCECHVGQWHQPDNFVAVPATRRNDPVRNQCRVSRESRNLGECLTCHGRVDFALGAKSACVSARTTLRSLRPCSSRTGTGLPQTHTAPARGWVGCRTPRTKRSSIRESGQTSISACTAHKRGIPNLRQSSAVRDNLNALN